MRTLLFLLFACTGEPGTSPETSAAGGSGLTQPDRSLEAFIMRLVWVRTAVPPPAPGQTLDPAVQKALLAADDKATAAFLNAAPAYTQAAHAVEEALKAGRAPTDAEAQALARATRAVREIALDAAASAADALGTENQKAIAGATGSIGMALGRGPLEQLLVAAANSRAPDEKALDEELPPAALAVLAADQRRMENLDIPLLGYRQAMGRVEPGAEASAQIRAAGLPLIEALERDQVERLVLARELLTALPAARRAALVENRAFRTWAGIASARDAFGFAFGLGSGPAGQMPGAGAQPGMGQPGMGQPGMGQPGMGQPGMGQPGMGQPGMDQPGMGAASGEASSPGGPATLPGEPPPPEGPPLGEASATP